MYALKKFINYMIYSKVEKQMTLQEVLDRLCKDLDMPKFYAPLKDKEYTEEEYQKLKEDLLDYYRNYVDNFEH